MTQEITKSIAEIALIATAGTGGATKLGWFAFVNANAPGLGVIATCVFGIIATIFYLITYLKKTNNTKEIDKLRIQNINNALEVERLNLKISDISDRKED